MRKITLGDLNSDKRLIAKIDESFPQAEKILKKEVGNLNLDFIFFIQNHCDEEIGVAFFRWPNFVEIRVDYLNPPHKKDLTMIILQAGLSYYITHNFSEAWNSPFLFDIFKFGTMLMLANNNGANWFLDDFDQFFNESLPLVKKIISKQASYVPEDWYENNKNYAFMEYFGERIMTLACQKTNKRWTEITKKKIF